MPHDLLPNSLPEEDNRKLCSLATLDENKVVVFQMHPNRAPGADGFNGAFYRAMTGLLTQVSSL